MPPCCARLTTRLIQPLCAGWSVCVWEQSCCGTQRLRRKARSWSARSSRTRRMRTARARRCWPWRIVWCRADSGNRRLMRFTRRSKSGLTWPRSHPCRRGGPGPCESLDGRTRLWRRFDGRLNWLQRTRIGRGRWSMRVICCRRWGGMRNRCPVTAPFWKNTRTHPSPARSRRLSTCANWRRRVANSIVSSSSPKRQVSLPKLPKPTPCASR